MSNKLMKLKLIQYRDFCKVRNVGQLQIEKLQGNQLFIVKPPEKVNIIAPISGLKEKIHYSNVSVSNEFYLASIENGLCLKNQVAVYGNKFLLPDSFRHYQYITSHKSLMGFEETNRFVTKQKTSKVRFQPGDSIFLSGEISQGYGHFLLEVISRLWISSFINLSQYKFIMNPEDNKQWQLDILKPFGISKQQIVHLNEPIRCERLHIPVQSFALRKYTSSFAYNTWEKIGDYYDRGIGTKKIYISRSKLNNKRRQLMNEKEVEKVFASYGFHIVHPQNLSVSQQINLFRNADIIAGPSGSGMYNSVFQKQYKKKLILTTRNFVKMSDMLINTSTKGELNYLFGNVIDNDITINHAKWIINTEKLKKFLNSYV